MIIFTQTEVVLYLQRSRLNDTFLGTLLWTAHCSEFLLFCPLPLWLEQREGEGQQSWWQGWEEYLCWVAEDSGLVQIGEKGVKGDLIAPCIFLRRRSREGDVWLFFLWYGKWEQFKVGPGRFRFGDFSSPRWWSNTGAACPEKWSKCQTCQFLRAFGLHILTFGQHWIGQTVGLDDHCRFLMTEIIYFILKSLQVNPDQHATWD